MSEPGTPVPDRPLARRLVIASIAASGATAVCYLLMVRTALGERFDQAADLGTFGQNTAVAAVNQTLLQQITADSLAVVLLVLLLVGLVRRRPFLGLGAAFAAGIAVVVTHVLKDHVLATTFLAPSNTSNTFPSDHTAAAVASAMALVLVSPPAWRGPTAVVAGAYGWITAVQVQSAGWHRPSDAIGASLVAFASVTVVAAILAWLRPAERSPRPPPVWSRAVLAAIALAATVATVWGLSLVLGEIGGHADLVDHSNIRQVAYLTGLTMTIAVVVLLLIVLVALIGRWDLDAPRAPQRLGATHRG